MQKKQIIRLLQLMLIVFACVATLDGVVTALAGQLYGEESLSDGSIDFQWSPSRVLLERTNPFKLFLELDARGASKTEDSPFILAQRASYPASSLIFLWPYAAFEWNVAKVLWLVTNLLSAIAVLIGVCRLADLKSRDQILWLTTIFIAGLPFRHTIGNGQHGIVCLAAFIWAVIWAEKNRYLAGLLLAVSWVKYTITMPLSLFFLTSKERFSVLLITTLIHVALTLFASVWVSSPVVDILLDPLRVASSNQGIGDLDLFSVIERMGYSTTGLPILLSLAVFVLILITVIRAQSQNDFLVLLFLCLVYYILPRHKQYDLVVLVLPLAYAIKSPTSFSGLTISGLIGFAWFGRKILETLGSTPIGAISPISLETIGFVLTGVIYYSTTLMVFILLWRTISSNKRLAMSKMSKS